MENKLMCNNFKKNVVWNIILCLKKNKLLNIQDSKQHFLKCLIIDLILFKINDN